MRTYHLAIDIGASSGRHILGWAEDGTIRTEEIYRFPNAPLNTGGHLTWNLAHLERQVRAGIDAALARAPGLKSLSIDTWGVDYVLLRDESPVSPVYAYRDARTKEIISQVHRLVPFSELYAHTGIQFQPFNTVYQLFADQRAGRLEGVTDFLMIPEYLMWRLTGVKAHEFTNATTGGLINAVTGQYDPELITRLKLPIRLFGAISQPGTVLGEYKGIRVVLCATHDTASAVEGIPMAGNEPYISSGTWSLLGVKTDAPITDTQSLQANYSNEGGVGYNRYQKNIMGMWLINELKKELCPELSFPEIVTLAEESSCDTLADVNAPAFLAPKHMKDAFDTASGNTLLTIGDYFRCACRSLAASYRDALAELESNTGKHYNKLYIVGGGAKNQFLNRLTEELTGKEVIALPIEATALGNLKLQMEAMI